MTKRLFWMRSLKVGRWKPSRKLTIRPWKFGHPKRKSIFQTINFGLRFQSWEFIRQPFCHFWCWRLEKKAPNERNCWKIWGSWDHHGHHMVVSCSVWGLLACTLHLDSATVIPMFDVKVSMYTMASKQLKSPTIPTMKPINFGYLHCICTVSYIARLYPYSTQWHFISPRIVDGNRNNKTNPI